MTRGDWWVTAALAHDEIRRRMDEEGEAPDLFATLTAIGDIYEQAAVALGSAIHALRADGASWREIAEALGYGDDDEVRHRTAEPRRSAERAIHARIGC
jgi:hypothetical protein